MPKKGYKQSPEHIAARRERTRETGMINGALDFFRFMMMLDPADRRELLADRIADAEETLKENDRLRARGAGRGIRNSSGSLSDPAYVERFRNALRDDIHRILSQEEDSDMTATHEPMTGQHSHTHAAFGADDADDGMHGHRHTHSDDADHDHAHDRASQSPGVNPDASASGIVGRQMGTIGPAERRRLRNAQIAEHEARRGGS